MGVLETIPISNGDLTDMPSSDTQFKKGNKAGKGRKKGTKNKISKVALNAIYRDLTDNAGDSIELLRDTDLSTYWRVIAGLIPKDLDVKYSGDVSVRVVQYSEDDE